MQLKRSLLGMLATCTALAAIAGCYWLRTDNLEPVVDRVRASGSPLIREIHYEEGDVPPHRDSMSS